MITPYYHRNQRVSEYERAPVGTLSSLTGVQPPKRLNDPLAMGDQNSTQEVVCASDCLRTLRSQAEAGGSVTTDPERERQIEESLNYRPGRRALRSSSEFWDDISYLLSALREAREMVEGLRDWALRAGDHVGIASKDINPYADGYHQACDEVLAVVLLAGETLESRLEREQKQRVQALKKRKKRKPRTLFEGNDL